MKVVNSLSGGKTSSYMAVHHPADYNLFALVMVEDPNCKPKDPLLSKYVAGKINREFIATAESDLTLRVVMDLEQKIGTEIHWVTGETFEQVIRRKKALPNVMWRFCTTAMKMQPIFDFCQNKIGGMVAMQVGFRYDEMERANKENTSFKAVVGQSESGRNRWDEIEWRELRYPLIENRVNHFDVVKWSRESGLIFPSDSNCVGCFHKPWQQLRKNWEDEPIKMQWFADMEAATNRNFRKEMTYAQCKRIGLQTEFNFGTGSGCDAGYCTD
jgi:hypothetical protein